MSEDRFIVPTSIDAILPNGGRMYPHEASAKLEEHINNGFRVDELALYEYGKGINTQDVWLLFSRPGTKKETDQ